MACITQDGVEPNIDAWITDVNFTVLTFCYICFMLSALLPRLHCKGDAEAQVSKLSLCNICGQADTAVLCQTYYRCQQPFRVCWTTVSAVVLRIMGTVGVLQSI